MSKAGPAEPGALVEDSDLRAQTIERLYREFRGDLCRFIQNNFGAGASEAEEIAQVAFERLSHIGSLKDIKNPRGFLHALAANAARDLYRRAKLRTTVHRDMAHRNRDFAMSDITPENVLESRERLAVLKTVLKEMPALRRRIFLLVRVEGYSVTEVARLFRMSEGAVYKHVSRAMHCCMAALDEQGALNKHQK